MGIRRAGAALGVMALVGAGTSCQEAGEALGETSEAVTTAYCLLNVHTDEGTVHFEGPDWLLASGEGRGTDAMAIDVRVLDFVQPAMSSTTTAKPTASSVSTAVGYSLTARYGVNDFSRLTVATGAFQRLEAYPTFQRTVFEIRDASCSAVLGTGAAYRPIGVFFKTVFTEDVPLPDVGVYAFDASCPGPSCDPGVPAPLPDAGP